MPESNPSILDRYLDGQLPADEHEAFAARVAADPDLHAQASLQHAIDAALRTIFVPTVPASILDPTELADRNGRVALSPPSAAEPGPARSRTRQFLAAAAMIAIVAVAAWRIYSFVNPPQPFDPYGPQPWRSMETVYHDKLDDGFVVDWECEDDQEFADTFERRLGQPLLLASLPPGVQSLGLGYCHSLTPRTVYLLARVDGREVVVFIDRLADDEPPPTPDDPSLNVFRREIGKLVLYEFTPHARPGVLDRFYNPASARPDP